MLAAGPAWCLKVPGEAATRVSSRRGVAASARSLLFVRLALEGKLHPNEDGESPTTRLAVTLTTNDRWGHYAIRLCSFHFEKMLNK